jgi:hypothetical protein
MAWHNADTTLVSTSLPLHSSSLSCSFASAHVSAFMDANKAIDTVDAVAHILFFVCAKSKKMNKSIDFQVGDEIVVKADLFSILHDNTWRWSDYKRVHWNGIVFAMVSVLQRFT